MGTGSCFVDGEAAPARVAGEDAAVGAGDLLRGGARSDAHGGQVGGGALRRGPQLGAAPTVPLLQRHQVCILLTCPLEVLVRHLILGLMLGCVAPQETPNAQQPPPPDLALRTTSSTPGGLVRLTAVGAPTGTQVWFLASRSNTATTCPAILQGACLDLISPHVVGSARADAGGLAVLDSVLPATTPTGVSLYYQAVVLRGPQRAVVSRPQNIAVYALDLDIDVDGLSNAEEVALGTLPGLADSDGGGITDGQEARVDGTDPNDATDDLGDETACGNSADDDLDGLVDCVDPDCVGLATCVEASCDDGRDDNANGLVDCEDPGCFGSASCGEQDCTDGLDDDGDGLIDCEDDACWGVDCHDHVLSWVTQVREIRIQDGAFASAHGVSGRVWVQGPLHPQGTSCGWSTDQTPADGDRFRFHLERGCQLDSEFLPAPSTLAWSPGLGVTTSTGAVWYGEARLPSWFQPGGEARGTCPVGSPTLAFVDRDGDGYGVSGGSDLFGQPPERRWVCGPLGPDLVTAGGDCWDDDPTWTPATVQLASYTSCNSVDPDDRDGDGVEAARDLDDNDGGVR